jgi:hypothetical protein
MPTPSKTIDTAGHKKEKHKTQIGYNFICFIPLSPTNLKK